jgi:hypothetical protein
MMARFISLHCTMQAARARLIANPSRTSVTSVVGACVSALTRISEAMVVLANRSRPPAQFHDVSSL